MYTSHFQIKGLTDDNVDVIVSSERQTMLDYLICPDFNTTVAQLVPDLNPAHRTPIT